MALVELTAPGDHGVAPVITAAAAETSGTTPRLQVVLASFLAIVGFWVLSVVINRAFTPRALVIPAGVSVFAMLYAVTQGLERLLEPISSFFFSTKEPTQLRNAALAAAVNVHSASGEELPARLSDLAGVAIAAKERLGKRSLARFHNPARNGVMAACEQIVAAYKQIREHASPRPDADGRDPDHGGTGLSQRAPQNSPTDAPKPSASEASATNASAAKTSATTARSTPTAASTAVTATSAGAVRKNAAKVTAAAQADLDQRRADKTIAYWALASILGMLLSATLGLYLLHTVGLTSDGLDGNGIWTGPIRSAQGVRHMLDLLVTGLALGGGTKPLHDLISNLQTSKNSKKDPA